MGTAELIALAVIGVITNLTIVWATQLLSPVRTNAVKVGDEFHLAKALEPATKGTIVIATSPFCSFSTQSEGFHLALTKEATALGINTALLVPPRSGTTKLESLAQRYGAKVIRARLSNLGITGTPSLLLLNTKGELLGLWQGLLGVTEQSIVRARLSGAQNVLTDISGKVIATPTNDSLSQLSDRSTILDIRTRAEFAQAHQLKSLNIPLDEMVVRAKLELDPVRQIIVDCTRIDAEKCIIAAKGLKEDGFSTVQYLNRGFTRRTCRLSNSE